MMLLLLLQLEKHFLYYKSLVMCVCANVVSYYKNALLRDTIVKSLFCSILHSFFHFQWIFLNFRFFPFFSVSLECPL